MEWFSFELVRLGWRCVRSMIATPKKAERLKKRIAELQKQIEQPTVVQNFHGNVGVIQIGADGMYRAPFDGKGEIVSPRPVHVSASGSATNAAYSIGRAVGETDAD